jgi:hypothetical protein
VTAKEFALAFLRSLDRETFEKEILSYSR